MNYGKCFVCQDEFETLADLQSHRFTNRHKINSDRNSRAIDNGLDKFWLYEENNK